MISYGSQDLKKLPCAFFIFCFLCVSVFNLEQIVLKLKMFFILAKLFCLFEKIELNTFSEESVA